MNIDKKSFVRTTAKLSLAVVALLLLTFAYLVFVPVDTKAINRVEIEVESGAGVGRVAETMSSEGLIRSALAFRIYATLTGQDKNIKAGRYLISPSLSLKGVLNVLTEGLAESDDIQVTIPEGSNVWEVDRILLYAKLISAAGDFARTQQKNEGYLFPDTYRFDKKLSTDASKQDNPERIAQAMLSNFRNKVGTIDRSTLVIASILEKEARSKTDMEIVSGIIKNRMDRGMLLQIDATVAYGWCFKALAARKYNPPCDVTQAPIISEIAGDGEYNSYVQKDLPPSPISNPGLVAISAALHPRDSEYLYYLSTRDGSQMIYSKTAAEHAQNRRKYLGL